MIGQAIKIKVYQHHFDRTNPTMVEGKVIFESKHFMTIQTKNYTTSVSQHDILIGKAVVM